MPSPTEIRSKAGKVSEMKSDISNESNRCNSQVENSSTWWQGNAANTERNGHKEIRSNLKLLINKMDELYSWMFRLSDRVQQADDARKAKAAAEAAARVAAAASAAREKKTMTNTMKR